MICIILSSVSMAIETPFQSELLTNILFYTDLAFIVIFAVETTLKILAFGLILDRYAYLKDGWNILDFIVVCVSIPSVLLSGIDLKWVRSFRALRVLRPLRVISRIPELRIVVNSLFSSLPGLGHVLLVSTLFWCIFGILGIQLFSG